VKARALLTLYDQSLFFIKSCKKGLMVISNHVNIIGSEFELDQQGLKEFYQPGHKGLNKLKTVKF